MRAELLAVGSELLVPPRNETNGTFLTGRLRDIGIPVIARVIVADDAAALAQAFRNALERSQIVIATGGLGPTEDDLTREAAAAALGVGLVRDTSYLEALKQRFARYRRTMAKVNEKQADLMEGGRFLENPRGSAPGQYLERDGRILVLLPGPPVEMEPMFDELVLPLLRERAGTRLIRRRVLKIASMGESDVDQAVAPIYRTFQNPQTTILGSPGQVELHLSAEAASEHEAEARIEALAVRLREALPRQIFSEDGRELPQVVAALIVERGLSLTLAESCTGGLLAARVSSVPGASRFFERGYVTYGSRAKQELLGVDPALLASFGAVSEQVARAMAEGARARAGASLAVGITGIAGPDGGTPEKPVGLVFVALSGAAGDRVRRAQFPGERERVRFQATQLALEMIRRGLLGLA
jgi:nicotinamide-nucleotide amidase